MDVTHGGGGGCYSERMWVTLRGGCYMLGGRYMTRMDMMLHGRMEVTMMKGRVLHVRGTLHDEDGHDVTWEDGGYHDEGEGVAYQGDVT